MRLKVQVSFIRDFDSIFFEEYFDSFVWLNLHNSFGNIFFVCDEALVRNITIRMFWKHWDL